MVESIRIFIAVLISSGLKRRIGLVQEEFKKLAPEVKWVDENNFHVTLKFLGNVASDRLNDISAALMKAVNDFGPFDIEIGTVGAFPNPGRPKTVWVGVTTGSEILAELAKRVENALEKLGFEKEGRSFKSHITIGRLKDDRGARELGPALKESKIGQLGLVHIDAIAVMKSELRREGPIYTKLLEIPLQKAGGEKDTNG